MHEFRSPFKTSCHSVQSLYPFAPFGAPNMASTYLSLYYASEGLWYQYFLMSIVMRVVSTNVYFMM